MTVHFICRGNVFRSVIAAAYLNSLMLPNIEAISSGSVADRHRTANIEAGFLANTQKLLTRHGLAAYIKPAAEQVTQSRISADQMIIFANRIAYDEAAAIVHLPDSAVIWDVTDIGEGNRIATTDAERQAFEEEIFAEITAKVDELVKQL